MKNRKVLLFLDNTTSHQESIQKNLSNIKSVFLPNNTTSRLQPLRYVISRMDDNKRASDIINEIEILKVIGWVKSAWREVTCDTKKHRFEKCGFPTDDYAATSQDSNEAFQLLSNEISANCSID